MKNHIYILIVSVLLISACKQIREKKKEEYIVKIEKTDLSSKFSIEILDDSALQIIDPKALIVVEASGFEWTEGPLWIDKGGYLLFSDIPNNKVHKLEADGSVSTYLDQAGHTNENIDFEHQGSNGLLLNTNGELVLMQHGNRQVAKMNAPLNTPKADFVTLADNYQGKRLNSPNDGVFDHLGNLYFTDPAYGLPKWMDDPAKELDFQGVYCLLTTGELLLIDNKVTRPNGITLSPDESKLYVAVSDPEHALWYQYDLNAPGVTKNKKIFFDVTNLVGKEGQQGLPDGMKTHSKGYLFATGPGGVWIFDLNGKPLARIYTGQNTANCALTTNEKKLFMTADDYLLSIDLK